MVVLAFRSTSVSWHHSVSVWAVHFSVLCRGIGLQHVLCSQCRHDSVCFGVSVALGKCGVMSMCWLSHSLCQSLSLCSASLSLSSSVCLSLPYIQSESGA